MKCLRYWPNTETRIGPFFIRTENHNTSRRYTIRHITIRKVSLQLHRVFLDCLSILENYI